MHMHALTVSIFTFMNYMCIYIMPVLGCVQGNKVVLHQEISLNDSL